MNWTAKDIVITPISKRDADMIIKKHHYSGKVTNNSCLHFGVFLDGACEGALTFGPPLDKRRVIGLVDNTQWHEMLELNRMAFSERLPRNSESRALGVVFKLIRKHYPHIKWVLSFSDAAQCGDGTIYRAAGFHLTQINPNKSNLIMPDGVVINQVTITANWAASENSIAQKLAKRYGITFDGKASVKPFIDKGGRFIEGYQLRYIYLLDKTAIINCPILPYGKIAEIGAGMYKGAKR